MPARLAEPSDFGFRIADGSALLTTGLDPSMEFILSSKVEGLSTGFRFALLLTPHPLPNYSIRPGQNIRRDRHAQCTWRFQIDYHRRPFTGLTLPLAPVYNLIHHGENT